MFMEAKNSSSSNTENVSAIDLLVVIVENKKKLILVPLLVGILAGAVSMAMPSIFTAVTVLLPSQQSQNAGMAALQSIGNLAGVPNVTAGMKNPIDQYVSLMQSNTVVDRIVKKHKLVEAYKVSSIIDARDILLENVRIIPGKKDGLLAVEVDDLDPKRAADIANEYAVQLHLLNSELAITDAQQRRLFFENQLQLNKGKLIEAQTKLQQSGVNQGIIRSEPKSAAETYAVLKAQITAAEVRLQSMRAYLTEEAPDFRQAQIALSALYGQLKKYEATDVSASEGEYISRYREFKYQEALFELFSKQFELAKLEESRDAALVQVIDPAVPPERKSRPKRFMIVGVSIVVAELILLLVLFAKRGWDVLLEREKNTQGMKRLQEAMQRK